MFSDQQLFSTPRRSFSSNKYKLMYPKKEPSKKSLALARAFKNTITMKLKNNFNMIQQMATKKQHLRRKLKAMTMIERKVKIRRGLAALKIISNLKIKKICGLKNLVALIKNNIQRNGQQALLKMKKLPFPPYLNKYMKISASVIFRILNRKIGGKKEDGFLSIKQTGKKKYFYINSLKNTLKAIQNRKKFQFFMKILHYNFRQKTSNLEFQPPTIESQQNIQYIQGIEEEENKILKKSTSDTNINSLTYRLRDNLEQKRKRSLSRKSRVSSLVQEDFTYVVTNSYSNKDFKHVRFQSQSNKNDYYKNQLKSYKKQLSILKSQLEVTKEMNENYEKELQGMISSQQMVNLKELKNQIMVLKKEKQRYKEKAKGYEKKIIEMKEEFRNRMEIVHMRVKKQL